MPTTLTQDGTIDVAGQKKIVDYLLANKAAAIGHLGGASEYYKVSQKDRELIISTVVEQVNGRVPVFIGNTCLSLDQSIENAKIADKLGADMLMVCSPIFGHVSQKQLFDYYHAVSQEVSLPIIVQDTGASADQYGVDFMLKLAREIPTVGYAKTEGPDFLRRTCLLKEAVKDGIQIIGGAAGFHMISLLRQGITAFMTGTEASEIHNAVINAWLKGDIDSAVHIYYTTLLPYLEIFNLSNRTMLKYMLKKRGLVENISPLFPNEEAQVPDIIFREFEWLWQRIEENRI
jgi:4-hydroxy-tetrahydrodipicolinate synthase